MIQFKDLENVQFSNIDSCDYPEYEDAYISYATLSGKELTDGQYELINNTVSDMDIWYAITRM